MADNGIDAYVVPSSDNHQSEYVGEYFMARKFITGFTGSAGTAVIMQDQAGLWTDGRYFIQAEKQLAGSGITLYRMGQPGVPTVREFLKTHIPENGRLGFYGRVVGCGEGLLWKNDLKKKNVTIASHQDLIDAIWTDRPAMACSDVFVLDETYTGEPMTHKLSRIRKVMQEKGANVHILSSLDDICWIINMRGKDVSYSPLTLAYAIIYADHMELFSDAEKYSEEARARLKAAGCTLLPYDAVYEKVTHLKKTDTVLLDPKRVNFALYENIPDGVQILPETNPEILMKAIKNETEIANIKKAHLKEGLAMTRYMRWVKENYEKETITEMSAAKKLNAFRKDTEGYLWESFAPICAFGAHAAMMHYSSTPETDVALKPGQFFLNDTGGNYYEGSTDTTRTFVLGDVSRDMKRDFTDVLRGHIDLAKARFLYGCAGVTLDILAREPLWERNLDYQCGTGHGVGYLLNIHEGPQAFRWRNAPDRLESGMIITDEPGIYIEGSHGIRTENELLIREGETNAYGTFMYMEPVTLCPIDLDGVIPERLTKSERDYLNRYHATCYKALSPFMTEEEKTWLKTYTRAL